MNTDTMWFVIGDSVEGKSHIDSQIPCQDYSLIKNIDKKMGIAVVSDGAGSMPNSHLGSKFVCERAIVLLEDSIKKNKWNINPPRKYVWEKESKKIVHTIYKELQTYANTIQVPVNTLACTIIMVMYTPTSIFSLHIGDGRAGYCTAGGEWLSLFAPYKGEEANQTVFITSLSNNTDIIETNAIYEDIKAFTLMSDGFENYAYITFQKKENEEMYTDINKPFPGFYNPIISSLTEMKDTLDQADIMNKWNLFLKEGNTKIQNEPDDKTLIVGFLTC